MPRPRVLERAAAAALLVLLALAGPAAAETAAVHITAPTAGAVLVAGDALTFTATARDAAGADVGAIVVWSSDRDGVLGAGTPFQTVLSAGSHVLTATTPDAADTIGLTVTPPLVQDNTAPVVTIVAPDGGHALAAGAPVRFAGTARDAEDGVLDTALAWTSDRDGSLGTGPSFTRALGVGIHRITARAIDARGAAGSATVAVLVAPPVTIALPATADASVDAGDPRTNFGHAATLRVDANTARQTYLRFAVTGVGTRAVTHAVLRLQVDAAEGADSVRGGTVYALPAGGWTEDTVTWATRPALAGTPLAAAGAVARGQLVDFDVGAAVDGDGVYDFALVTDSEDEATYRSREGGPAPELVVTLAGAPPVVTITAPTSGTAVRVGDAVTLAASAEDAADGDLGPTIAWLSSRDGFLGTGRSLTLASLALGTHTITAAAVDAEGAIGSAEIQLVVQPPSQTTGPSTPPPSNVAPVVTVVAPVPNATVLAHAPVVLAATARDAEDGDLGAAIRWLSSRDGVLGTGATVAVPSLSAGTHVLSASVVDRAGVPATASLMVTVVPDELRLEPVADTYVDAASPDGRFGHAPALLAGVTPASRFALLRFAVSGIGGFRVAHAVLRLTAQQASAAGGTLTGLADASWNEDTTSYATRPTIQGPALGSLGAVAAGQVVEVDVSRTLAGDGSYGFALAAAADGVAYASREAASGRPQLVVTLAGASAPVVTIRSPAANVTLDGGAAVTLDGSATDGAGHDASAQLRWTSSVDGPLGTGATVRVPRLTPGTHLVVASVTAADGTTGDARVAVVVRPANAAPRITILSPGPGAVLRPATSLRMAAVVADDQDASLAANLTWTSSRDGILGTGGVVVATLSSGPHVLTATVTDSGGKTGTAQVAISVGNAPVVTVTSPADGTSVVPGTTVTLAATATDVEEGNLGARIVWTSDLDGSLGSGPLVRVATLRSGLHTLIAAVVDATGARSTASVTLLVNAPPVLAITAPAPNWRFITGDAITLAASATDSEDGDLGSRVVWSSDVDGPLGVGRSVTVSTLSQRAQVITAAVADRSGAVVRATVPLSPYGCLVQTGPLAALTGTIATSYSGTFAQLASRLDVRAATFLASATNRYPLDLVGASGLCVGGGVILGQYDRSLTWAQMHYDNNNAGVAFDNLNLTVDGVRIDNVTDGIRPRTGDDFTIRNTRMSYVRDDCVENDHLRGGLVDDSLLDGCYVAFSARPSQAIIDSGWSGVGKLWTIQNSLIRLQPMPGPDGPTDDGLGTGGFFKWHLWNDPASSLSPKLALTGNVFMAERVGEVGGDRMGVPPEQLQSCSNNVMVWLGPGPFPASLPSCFTVTTDRTVWDNAVADWERRHPQVPR